VSPVDDELSLAREETWDHGLAVSVDGVDRVEHNGVKLVGEVLCAPGFNSIALITLCCSFSLVLMLLLLLATHMLQQQTHVL